MRLEVGRVAKPHGLRGELIVALTSNRSERMQPGAVLFAGDRRLVVRAAARHQERWRVAFEGVTDRDAADRLHGALLTADPIDDADALWVHELMGCAVVDQHGVARGRITEIHAQPAGDLALLDTGHLVPLRFVTGRTADAVAVDAPEGLFDLLD